MNDPELQDDCAFPATVIHVDAERGFSGGEVQVFYLMRGLAQKGWKQVLIAPPGSALIKRVGEESWARAVEFESVGMRNSADLGAVLGLRQILKRYAVRGRVVLHLHTGRATWLGALASCGLGVFVVTTRRMDRRVKRGLGTRLIYGRLVDRAVAISGAVRSALELGGVPREKTSVIHSSVDPKQLVAGDGQSVRRRMRDHLKIGEGELVLLVLARLDRRKGIDVLLTALDRVRAESGLAALRARNKVAASSARRGMGPNNAGGKGAASQLPRLLIAGDGPMREQLEDLSKQLELGDLVEFLGHRDDRTELLAAADVFVLPSRREGLGVAALEAMAAGVAVVASRVGGLGEAVVDETSGLLVEPENAHMLAQTICRLIDDRSLVRRLGAAGPARIRAAYHVDGMVSAYEELYGQLLGNRELCENTEP